MSIPASRDEPCSGCRQRNFGQQIEEKKGTGPTVEQQAEAASQRKAKRENKETPE
jgi:hypothetical protein